MTKIGTEVAQVTRDSVTTFKVKGQKSTCRGGVYCGGLLHSYLRYCLSQNGEKAK